FLASRILFLHEFSAIRYNDGMTISSTLSPTALAAYRQSLYQRRRAEEEMLAERKARATEVAQKAANILKQRFGATKVVLFGSLAHGLWYSITSDIDLAAWGIAPENYFRAVAHLQDIAPEFSIDLVTMEECPAPLSDVIAEEGRLL
ncbi:MAG: nucleotidyltransferase domain-containing protein, partial [Caldilineaceae bacterium]|nr:nucleotidyltransferase domain-containing protein [Caldilineaceae bacterium]